MHLVCPLGDPLDPRVWSGAPFQVSDQLKQMSRLGDSLNAKVGRGWRVLDEVSRFVLHEQDRGPDASTLIHKIRVNKTAKLCKRFSRNGHVLHFGTREFPYNHGKLTRQYLFVDSAFRSWMREALSSRLSDRMLDALDRREQLCFQRATHIFTMGEYCKDIINRDYGVNFKKITPVGSGTGSIQPYLGPRKYERMNILFVAKSDFTKKGGELLVEGVRKARHNGLAAELTLVGQTSYPESFHDYPWLTLLGRLPPGTDQLQRLYESHSLFAMPSFYDAWGIA